MIDILLQELNSTDLDWMADIGERRSLHAGDRLTLSATDLYCILDGEMVAVAPANSGDISDGAAATPFTSGDILGSAVLLDLPAVIQDVEATQATSVLVLSQQTLRQHIRSHEAFAARFYRALTLMLAQRLRQYAQSMELRQHHQRDLQEALLVLGELRDSDIDWLTVTGRVRTIAPGDFLLRAGRPIDALYLVLEGRFAVLWLEDDNPLKVCFNCPIETASQMRQIATLAEGEMAGVSTFLDARPLPVSIRAEEEALVLCIPRETVTTRLLQDHGFAVRFYRVLAIQLSKMVQDVLMENGTPGHKAPDQSSPSVAVMEDDELDIDDLQHASQGAARFNWMRQRLGVG